MWKAWQEGLANKASSKLAGLLTDDFVFITRLNTRTRQLTLDWTAAGGNPSVIDDLEVLYENDEVAVIHDNVKRGDNDGVSTGVFTMGKHMPEKINSPEVESVIGEFAKSIPGFEE